jgi:hypothetical protein
LGNSLLLGSGISAPYIYVGMNAGKLPEDALIGVGAGIAAFMGGSIAKGVNIFRKNRSQREACA